MGASSPKEEEGNTFNQNSDQSKKGTKKRNQVVILIQIAIIKIIVKTKKIAIPKIIMKYLKMNYLNHLS